MTLKTDWQRLSVVRLLILLGVAGTESADLPPAYPADDAKALETSFERQVKPFLQQHCERCHDEEKLTSGIRVDQLDAAKELAEFEEEKYQKAVANRDELESLSAQADLNGSKETVEKAQRTLVKLDEKVNEARRRRDEAQEKVHQLAKQIAGD